MKIYQYPDRADWEDIIKRPSLNAAALEQKVRSILDDVKATGDAAVKKYTQQFDGVALNELAVSESEINEAAVLVSAALKQAIRQAAANIELFHAKQLTPAEMVETMPGVKCWRQSVGIEKVGLYIPGGSAPLFSTLLMLGIPATLAGCKEIVLCSPPGKDGKLHPAILFAAQTVGVTKIFKAGGVQAIAAMAYGTGSIPRVYKIFGPGNQYVTCAKQLVQHDGTAIDMPAGPSEVAVFADETARPAFIAADLLSQAEHGPDSQVLLVAGPGLDIDAVQQEITAQLNRLPRKDIAAQALENSKIVRLQTEEEAAALLNEYAAEHLIISCADPIAFAARISNAGSIFLGNYSPESVGDYASGTNHTLPTNGYAKAYSGVSVDSFVKKITFQQLTPEGLNNIGRIVEIMATEEGLEAHANAVRIRMSSPGDI